MEFLENWGRLLHAMKFHLACLPGLRRVGGDSRAESYPCYWLCACLIGSDRGCRRIRRGPHPPPRLLILAEWFIYAKKAGSSTGRNNNRIQIGHKRSFTSDDRRRQDEFIGNSLESYNPPGKHCFPLNLIAAKPAIFVSWAASGDWIGLDCHVFSEWLKAPLKASPLYTFCDNWQQMHEIH